LARWNFKLSKKAVSPVIATLLVVAIAVAAAVVTYVWSMGLLGGLMGTGGQQTKEQLILEFYDWKTAGAVTFALRNVGSVNVQVAAVYLEGGSLGAAVSGSVNVGSTVAFSSISQPTGITFSQGASYTLKVITATGGTFTYSVVCGRAG